MKLYRVTEYLDGVERRREWHPSKSLALQAAATYRRGIGAKERGERTTEVEPVRFSRADVLSMARQVYG